MFNRSVISAADPYPMPEISSGVFGDSDISGDTLSTGGQTLNGGIRNCVLITAGQSNIANNATSLYVPTNGTKVDNLNPYNGATYAYKDPIMGCSGTLGVGKGNPAGRLADKLINANKFDRVIILPIALDGTSAADWQNTLYPRMRTAFRRLAYRGMTATAILWGQGEQDNFLGTLQGSYTTTMSAVIGASRADGFSGPWFIAQQTWRAGVTSAAVQAAQAALVNHSSNIWAGPNSDSLDATNRQADNTHWNDTGADAYAGLWQTALAAFGAPF